MQDIRSLSDEELQRIVATQQRAPENIKDLSDEDLQQLIEAHQQAPTEDPSLLGQIGRGALGGVEALGRGAVQLGAGLSHAETTALRGLGGLVGLHLPDVTPPLGDPSSLLYKTGDVAGSAAMMAIPGTKIAKGIEYALPIARGIPAFAAGTGLAAAALSPEEAKERALTGLGAGVTAGALGYALPAAARAIRATGRIPAAVTQRGATRNALNFVRKLLGKDNLATANRKIALAAKQDYSNALKQTRTNYKNVRDFAEEKGYPKRPGRYIPGISIGLPKKSINAPLFSEAFEDIKAPPKAIKNIVNEFNQNPSFENAHWLQSKLGKRGATLKSSIDSEKRNLADDYFSARNSLLSDMENSLISHGDEDLLKMYEGATNFHGAKVAPYLENSKIRSLVLAPKGKVKIPSNIENILKKDEDALNFIKENLDAPTKDLILARTLKNAISRHPKKGLQVNPNKLLKEFGDLKEKGFEEFIRPEHEQNILAIEHQLRIANALKPYLKIGAKTLVGGALGGLGFEGVRRVF